MRSLIPAAKHRSAHCKRRRIQQPDQHIAACLLLGGTGKAAQAASPSSTSFEDTVVRCAVHLRKHAVHPKVLNSEMKTWECEKDRKAARH
jgi:hypothetical protein